MSAWTLLTPASVLAPSQFSHVRYPTQVPCREFNELHLGISLTIKPKP